MHLEMGGQALPFYMIFVELSAEIIRLIYIIYHILGGLSENVNYEII